MAEETSPDVASVAARVLPMSDKEIAHFAIDHPEQLRSLAGSALTQDETPEG